MDIRLLNIFQCAEKILGADQSQEIFDQMTPQSWQSLLERRLRESGLLDAIDKLTKELVDQGKRRTFLFELDSVYKQIRKMSQAQE
jgi:hypothetical protein